MQPEPPPGGDDPRLRPLVDYLEQHRGQINVEALRKELRSAGHPPELVDVAVRRVVGEQPAKALAWPFGLLVALANLVAIPFPFFGLIGIIVDAFPAANDNFYWLGIPLLAAALIPGAELAVGLRLRGGPRDRLGRALIWGAALTFIGMALLLVLFGICVAVILSSY